MARRDDYSADIDTTGTALVDGSVTGIINSDGDQDWFRVRLREGNTYQIDLEGAPTSQGTISDTYFQGIYDRTGLLIDNTQNDDGGVSVNSQLFYTPESTGIYFLAAAGYSTNTGSYSLSVTNHGNQPLVSLERANEIIEGDDGVSYVRFIVRLDQAADHRVRVDFNTGSYVGDSYATPDMDFADTFETLNFRAGRTVRRVDVAINGDTEYEADEYFFGVLDNVRGGLINPSQSTAGANIPNDDDIDRPLMSISARNGVQEGDDGSRFVRFNVSLTEALDHRSRVTFNTFDSSATAGEDYAFTQEFVTFRAGQTSRNVRVEIFGDTDVEGDELFGARLTNARRVDLDPNSNQQYSYVEIRNDDSGTLRMDMTGHDPDIFIF